LLRPDLSLPPTLPSIQVDVVVKGELDRSALRPILGPLFARYLRTGGYLLVINDVGANQMISPETYEQFREALVGEFTRAGMRESYVREVVAWLSRHLGSQLSARGLAMERDRGSEVT